MELEWLNLNMLKKLGKKLGSESCGLGPPQPTPDKRDSGVAVNHPEAQTRLTGNETPARETSPVH